jgi:hypothetical protein
MRVDEDLFNGGDGVTVLDHYFDLMVPDFQGRQTAVAGC